MTPKCILFDLDGTLLNSLEGMYAVYLEFLRSRDCAGTKEEFEQLNGPTLRNVVRTLRKTHDLKGSVEELYSHYISLIEGRSYVDSPLHKGAPEILTGAAGQGIVLGLVTCAPNASTTAILEAHGLRELFSATVCAEDVVRGKPDPEGYRKAMHALDVSPEACLVVEDSVNGVRAGVAAGAFCCAVAHHRSADELLDAGATFTVSGLDSLRGMLLGAGR